MISAGITRMKHTPPETHWCFLNEPEVGLVSAQTVSTTLTHSKSADVLPLETEWNCATPLTALIPASPTAAAGMWKALVPKKKRRTDCEKLCNMSVRPARNLQSQEMETTLTVQFPQCFCCTLWKSERHQAEWEVSVGCLADRLHGLTSHHQRVYDGTLSGAVPLKLPHCCVSSFAFWGGVKSPDLTSCWGSSQAFHCLWECACAQGTLHIWQLLLATSCTLHPPRKITICAGRWAP